MPKKAKPAYKSSTIWGGVLAVAMVAVPILQERLATGKPISTTEAVSLGLAIVGGLLVVRGRVGEPAPVRGWFKAKGNK